MSNDDDDSLETLITKFRWLRLPGTADLLRSLLEEAASNNFTTLDILHRLAGQEKARRFHSAVRRRVHAAKCPEINTADGSDFAFSPSRRNTRGRCLAVTV